MRTRMLRVLGLSALLVLALPALAFAGDPNGADTLAEAPNAPITFIWMLVAGFLVYFMQAGFAMVESGFCRAKNASNLMMKNLLDFVMGSLAYFAVGFAFMYGADKSAAKQGRWRTPESTLHTIALVGGWPGALIARQVFRHKTITQPFRTIFWVTVIVNCVALAWFAYEAPPVPL